MHEIIVEAMISAAHYLELADSTDGESPPERVHGHNWKVELGLQADRLNRDAMVMDFHVAETMLVNILAPYAHRNLRDIPPFDQINPTAETLAELVFQRATAELGQLDLDNTVRVAWVEVTETPTCRARYYASRQ